MKKKIFFPLDPNWGLVMQRITLDIQRFAPPEFEFVDSHEKADIVFWHVIGPRKIPNDKPYVMLFHCFGRDRGETALNTLWNPSFKNALMVYGYYPLHKFLKEEDMKEINYVRRPWGVDPELFYKEPSIPKKFTCLATGYVSKTESILELYRACEKVGGKLLHIGGPIEDEVGILNPMYYQRVHNITDHQMREAYNSCKWTSALRRIEGYELPALEGFLCGSQPICFDIPDFYKHWFGDFATFVPHSSEETVTNELAKLFQTDPLISDKKVKEVTDKFNVEKLSMEFWHEFKKTI